METFPVITYTYDISYIRVSTEVWSQNSMTFSGFSSAILKNSEETLKLKKS